MSGAYGCITLLRFIVRFYFFLCVFRDKHEPERLALNGLADTTVAMEVT